MRALQVAYSAFLADDEIPTHKRRAENYRVEFHQDHKNFKIDFIAKRTPSGLGQLDGGSCELGRDVTYVVSKRTFELAYRIFYK